MKFCLLFCLIASSIFQTGDEAIIEAKMRIYDDAIRKMDVEAVVGLFAKNGEYGLVVGHQAIRDYLNSYKNLKVLEYSSTTTSISLNKGNIYQEGAYVQTGMINGQKKTNYGLFKISWIKEDGDWKIATLSTYKNKSK